LICCARIEDSEMMMRVVARRRHAVSEDSEMVHGSTIERCYTGDSEFMHMVARRKLLLSRFDSEMCMMVRVEILYC